MTINDLIDVLQNKPDRLDELARPAEPDAGIYLDVWIDETTCVSFKRLIGAKVLSLRPDIVSLTLQTTKREPRAEE